ncbi:MAG: HAMP domain-containing protein [Acidobacteria bacterium]|nr:HAMP domain-containing protein [Acidobacteriota bacterium]MBW4044050.1 HAMP domain-containing protein [Acidobacteriota bacterium]
MFSRISGSFYRTAAWRLTLRSTIVFAAGSAAVFAVMFVLVAQAVRERSDSWLIGESETLKQVTLSTPEDSLHDRIVEEVAELATQEVGYDAAGHKSSNNIVFFVQTSAHQPPLWVGPGDSADFLEALDRQHMQERTPVSLKVAGWSFPFRVVAADMSPGSRVYLGLHDSQATTLLSRLLLRFILGWLAMVGIGFFIALLGLRRMLHRVDAITTAAANIGTGDLSSRVAAGTQNDEVARLARTFNNMLDRISASVNQLRTLTDSVAHDLKSPITSVRGTLEVALSAEDENFSRELVASAIENLDRLSNVITTSLDLAEAEGGALRLHVEMIDLAELSSRVFELYAPAFTERGQSFEVSVAHVVRAEVDLRLFTRLLTNLMENELRYAGEAACIRVTLDADDTRVRLCVSDNGPGFPPTLLGNLFQRFARGSESQGHGLGMAFVSAVAQAHQGSATARNNNGAQIVVEIPLRYSPLNHAGESAPAAFQEAFG